MTRWQPERAIAAGRSLQNMTQAELAQRLTAVMGEEWTRGMVAALESGRKTFDVHTLQAVSKIQAMPVSFYLEGIITGDSQRYEYSDGVNGLDVAVITKTDTEAGADTFISRRSFLGGAVKDLEPAPVLSFETPNLFDLRLEKVG